MRSNSQRQGLTGFERLAYLSRLALMHVDRLRRPGDFAHLSADLDAYRLAYRRATGRELEGARILEIGYGQRPFRLMLLQSLGLDVRGVDLDRPLYRLDAAAIASVFRSNGAVRGLKSLLRRAVFDGSEYRALGRVLSSRYGRTLSFDPDTMIVGDAASPEVWTRIGTPLDFVYSEDVFEHIPGESLSRVVAHLADALADDGVAVVTPMVFTGICGGHDIGWYPFQVEQDGVSRGPAWGHLTGEAPAADTYLNRMTLAEYRELFRTRFEILREERLLGDIGRRHLTAERRAALAAYGEDELFSNNVRFVLRKKAAPAGTAAAPH